jgi:hypothetical protein
LRSKKGTQKYKKTSIFVNGTHIQFGLGLMKGLENMAPVVAVDHVWQMKWEK